MPLPFRDRVIQHLLYNYIAPLLDKRFIYDSYSCRVGKGTLCGIQRFDHHLRSVTGNYRYQAYILQLDVQGYFMAIVRERLYLIVWDILHGCRKEELEGLDLELIDYLLRAILFRDPVKNAIRIGPLSDWDNLPASKSLLKSSPGIGLPIGDLTSQLFSNVYLGRLDEYVKRVLKVEHYGRYVDDFYLMHNSKGFLLEAVDAIREYLWKELCLTLHPKKIRLVPACYGGKFLGAYILPHRMYVANRTVRKFHASMSKLELECTETIPTIVRLTQMRSVINSYCGYMKHFRCFRILDRQFRESPLRKYFGFTKDYGKAFIPGDDGIKGRFMFDDLDLMNDFLLSEDMV